MELEWFICIARHGIAWIDYSDEGTSMRLEGKLASPDGAEERNCITAYEGPQPTFRRFVRPVGRE
jgi:hypothetical protein